MQTCLSEEYENMRKVTLFLLIAILFLSCERNDMFEFAQNGSFTFTVIPGDTQLYLSWKPISGAAAYNISYNTTNDPGLATQFGGDITATDYTITGLSNWTLYYVWLSVKYDAGGTAEICASGNGMPGGIPAAPGMPTTPSATISTLSFSWTAVSGAAAYEVWFNTIDDSATAAKSGGDITATSYTITGLSSATMYYIWIKAKNSFGTSGFSPSKNGMTL